MIWRWDEQWVSYQQNPWDPWHYSANAPWLHWKRDPETWEAYEGRGFEHPNWPPKDLKAAGLIDECPCCGVSYARFRAPAQASFDEAYAEVFAESEAARSAGDYSRPADRRAVLGRLRQYKLTGWFEHLHWCDEEQDAADAVGVTADELREWNEDEDALDDLFGSGEQVSYAGEDVPF